MNQMKYEERIKELEDEVRVMRERYQILVECTEALLFEYRPEDDTMIFVYNFPDNKSRKEIPNYHEYVKVSPLVHPEHLQNFMDVLEKASLRPVRGELEYLSKVSTGEFQWHKTVYSSIADKEGKVISVLGRILNIHKAETERRDMIHKVETDFLTGLYNKGVAMEKINRWLKNNPTKEAHLVMMDLDNFKSINDRYGHTYGDEVLVETARVIEECFSGEHILSRFGGDEFVIFAIDEPTKQVESRVDKMMNRLAEEKEELQQSLHCSVGIAARVSKTDCFEELFNRADNAMYIAKQKGKNRYCVYG
jgi:diguanylate cyclase (GGDEF)-like protein